MGIDWENAFRVGFIDTLKLLKHERMLSLCCRMGVSLCSLKNPFKAGTDDHATWVVEWNAGRICAEEFCKKYPPELEEKCYEA